MSSKIKRALHKAWDWLTENNMKKLSFLGGLVVAVAGFLGYPLTQNEPVRPPCAVQTAQTTGAVAANNCGSDTVTKIGAKALGPATSPSVLPTQPISPSGQTAQASNGAAAVNNSSGGSVNIQLQVTAEQPQPQGRLP